MKNQQYDKTHLAIFMLVYKSKLEQNYKNNPSEYSWSLIELPEVVRRMEDAIMRGTFNKDSKSIKQTCKQLEIKHTYKAIKAFIERGEK